ncbi:hypothetical protein AVME950_04695 [Acidovorax sp. SUPP950]|uniref:hypothetical protein n=1 Tax=Acidovorax sp. SUPP950 TaxID=511901 RepID=UPI0023BF142B|nr:hypothetical protein [Acidovorax sp. SUPP950]GKS74157.1 hypothetical protein AVME950_04695 [Acidovorax sp. SUPP950]
MTAVRTALAASASAQTDTLKKIRESATVTVGIRDVSGAMPFTKGLCNPTGFR